MLPADPKAVVLIGDGELHCRRGLFQSELARRGPSGASSRELPCLPSSVARLKVAHSGALLSREATCD